MNSVFQHPNLKPQRHGEPQRNPIKPSVALRASVVKAALHFEIQSEKVKLIPKKKELL